jgi:hypothetical protein
LANRVSNVANTYKGVGASKMHKVTGRKLTRLALTTKRKAIKMSKSLPSLKALFSAFLTK